MNSLSSLSFFFVFFVGGCSAMLPYYIKACSMSDPNRRECFIHHGNEALPHLLKGDRDLRLQSLSPMRFDLIVANVGNLKLTLRDVDIFGLESANLTDLDIDWNHQMWFLECELKHVTLLGSYKVGGQILVLPVSGEGSFNLTFDSLKFKHTFFYKIEIRHGKEFSLIEDNDTLDWKADKVYFQFDNLFNGNKAMGDNVNKFLNDNGADVMKELEGTVADVIKSIGHRVYNSVFETFPLEEIFLV